MRKQILTPLAILALIALPLFQLGCAGADNANASEDGGAETTASKQTEGEQGDDAEDDKEGKQGKDGEDGEDEKKEEAVPVEVAELSQGAIESVLRFSTNLEAENRVQVFSQAKRLVTELLVEEGDSVRRGQTLVRLQDDEQRSALEKVRAQLAKEEREYARMERLFKQDLVSEQEYNDATYERDQLRIELADAERELGYTRVTAPISGRVTARMVNLGDQVQIGQHLFDVVDFESIVARVFVPEQHLDQLRPGLNARLSSQATGSRSYVGKVDRIAPVVDPRSGTVKVTIDVGGQDGLRPGMYVDVDLVTATNPSALLVPKRALVYDNDQMYVFRLGDERRVERIFIQPRLTDKFHVEPLTGLDVGDQVITAGQAGLKDGALVRLPGDESEEDETGTPDASTETRAAERASL